MFMMAASHKPEMREAMPASIAAEMAEAPFGSPHYHALFATGIALFVMTFIFNAIAFRLAQKYKTPAV